MRLITVLSIATIVSCTAMASLSAQDRLSPPKEGSPSGVIPPCPSVLEQMAAVGEKTKDGIPAAPVQPAEGSIILPSAGGDSKSAAPSAQQDGQALRSPLDCPMAPNHPNAPLPNSPPPPEILKR